MGSWTSFLTDALWRNALAVIPLVLLVTAACRWIPSRPATRHALWLFVLAWLIVPPMLPSFDPGSAGHDAMSQSPISDEVIAKRQSSTLDLSSSSQDASSPNSECTPAPITCAPVEPISTCAETTEESSYQAPTPPWTDDSTMLRELARLASAADLVGSLSAHGPNAQQQPDFQINNDERLDHSSMIARESLVRLPAVTSPPRFVRNRRPESFAQQPAIEPVTQPVPPYVIDYSIPRETGTPLPEFTVAQRVANSGITDSCESALPSESIEPSSDLSRAPRRYLTQLIDTAHPWVLAITNVRDAVGRLPAIPATLWFGGIALLVSCRTIRAVHVRKILRQGRRAPADVTAMVRRAARRIGLRQVPQVLLVSSRVSPMVWCGLKPRLILPRDLWDQLDDLGREAVLLHELAHIRRRDHVITWIESIVGSLYWWHPVVWWVRTRLREEAENCCDAWVTWLLPRGRRAYAEALLVTRQYVTEGGASAPAIGMGVISGRARRFGRRLTMVMTQRSAPNFSLSGIALTLAMASAGWLATPASSCPQSDAAAPKAATCTTINTTAPTPTVVALPAELPTPAPLPSCSVGETVAGTPAPPVVAVSPAPVALPSLAMAPSIISPTLPAQMLFSAATAPPARRSDNLEERLERLERQLERLSEQLGQVSGGRGGAPAPMRTTVPRTPSAPVLVSRSGGEETRFYELSGDKLKMLTSLMVRDDVPVKVRASEEGIEVIAPHEQQMIFEAFVNMINQPDATRYYELNPGKLKALNELMSLNDVPVMVHPGEDKIGVNGGGAVQTIFGAFVQMIDPDAKVAQNTIRRVEKDVKWKKELEEKLHKSHKSHGAGASAGALNLEFAKQLPPEARAEIERALVEASRAQSQAAAEAKMAMREAAKAMKGAKREARQRIRSTLQQKARGAEDRARQLERQADELEQKADQLRDKADSLRERAEASENHEEAAEMLSQAEMLDSQAAEIEAGSEQLLAQVDHFGEIAESLADSAEESAAAEEEAEAVRAEQAAEEDQEADEDSGR